MYADWKEKTKLDILHNIFQKRNFVLQQFYILRSFLSAAPFSTNMNLSLMKKQIW